ncbi:MAG TPA: hypothetical protein VG710_14200, partial [Opitutus sp.]|nr:hypothetical protein [Opitutus sp.]
MSESRGRSRSRPPPGGQHGGATPSSRLATMRGEGTAQSSGARAAATVACFGEILWDCLPRGIFLGGAPTNAAYHLAR